MERFLDAFPEVIEGEILEPCAGEGHIVRAVNRWMLAEHGPGVHERTWTMVELRRKCEPKLQGLGEVFIHDYLRWGGAAKQYRMAITNPPFGIAEAIVAQMIAQAAWAIALLRLDFLASGKRASFLREHMPDVYVIPDRPKFVGEETDKYDYGWFVWGPERQKRGQIVILESTPLAVRRVPAGEWAEDRQGSLF